MHLELRGTVVIYLTLSMTCAVRVLSVFLTVWLTATAAFPPCCWSMTATHEHPAQQESAASAAPSHDHHHHGSTEPAAPAEALALSAGSAHTCDTESAEAIAAPRPSHSSIDLRVAMAAPAGFTMPHTSARRIGVSDFAPPAAPFDSAFLNPLRV